MAPGVGGVVPGIAPTHSVGDHYKSGSRRQQPDSALTGEIARDFVAYQCGAVRVRM
jgi:hypothetical protein